MLTVHSRTLDNEQASVLFIISCEKLYHSIPSPWYWVKLVKIYDTPALGIGSVSVL